MQVRQGEPQEALVATPAGVLPFAEAGYYALAQQDGLPALGGSAWASWGAPAVRDAEVRAPRVEIPGGDVAAWASSDDFPPQDVAEQAVPDATPARAPLDDFPVPAGPVQQLPDAVRAGYAAWAQRPDAHHDRPGSAC